MKVTWILLITLVLVLILMEDSDAWRRRRLRKFRIRIRARRFIRKVGKKIKTAVKNKIITRMAKKYGKFIPTLVSLGKRGACNQICGGKCFSGKCTWYCANTCDRIRGNKLHWPSVEIRRVPCKYKDYDTSDKGYFGLAQLAKFMDVGPNDWGNKKVFDLLDQNKDGKVTETEFNTRKFILLSDPEQCK